MTEKEERLKPQESFFRIVNYLIEEAHFQVKKTEGGIISYSLELEPSFDDIQREGKRLVRVVTLYVFAKGEQEGRMVHDISVKIRAVFEAVFESEDKVDEGFFDKLCRLNGLMNMLLIARAFITTTTGQIGIQPVVIPFMNLMSVSITK